MSKSRKAAAAGAARGGDRRTALFLDRVSAVWDVKPAEAADLLSLPRRSSFWINRLRAPEPQVVLDELAALEIESVPVPWYPAARHLLGDKRRLVESAAFREGRVYLQNASSFLPVLALAVAPGASVLDVCAAPGGKAAHLAVRLGNDLQLWLNDAIPARLPKLAEVVALHGIEPRQVTSHPGQYIDRFVDLSFDGILLDAQCSGEGMVDLSHPGALRFWSLDRVEKMSRLQQRMLMAAFKLLKPGGLLVYSTCTISPDENEAPLDHLLRHRPEADVVALDLDVPNRRPGLASWQGRRYDPRLSQALRVLPSELMEPFFVCLLRRRATSEVEGEAG